jgi:hypothetical protein
MMVTIIIKSTKWEGALKCSIIGNKPLIVFQVNDITTLMWKKK